jgi:hypothetical protein
LSDATPIDAGGGNRLLFKILSGTPLFLSADVSYSANGFVSLDLTELKSLETSTDNCCSANV